MVGVLLQLETKYFISVTGFLRNTCQSFSHSSEPVFWKSWFNNAQPSLPPGEGSLSHINAQGPHKQTTRQPNRAGYINVKVMSTRRCGL